MPHKRNPILSENVTGLARLLRGWSVAAMEDVALWHERDISHSSVERIAIPDACLALDFALHRINRVLTGLTVDTDRMRANLDASHGLVLSQGALLALIRAGKSRDEAYRIVQQAATVAKETGGHLRDSLAGFLDDATLHEVFSVESFLEGARESVDRLAKLTPEWLRESKGGW